MPKKLFKRLAPDAAIIQNHPSLAFLGKLLQDPYLFHLNRRSVPLACLVGVFCAFLPLPAQMAIAAVTSLIVNSMRTVHARANQCMILILLVLV